MSAAHGSQWTVWDHRGGLQLGRENIHADYGCMQKTKQNNNKTPTCVRVCAYTWICWTIFFS